MGAEFIFEVVEADKPYPHWATILGELDDGKVQNFIDRTHYEYRFDDMTPQEVVERIDEAFDNIWNQPSRETGLVMLEGKQYFLTGGMSWGDDPTDIFPDFEIVADFQRLHADL